MFNKFFKIMDKLNDKIENSFNSLNNTFTSISSNFCNDFNFETMNNEIIINGKKYKGSSIKIDTNGNVYVDGKKQESSKPSNFKFELTGNVKNIDCSSITINGNVSGNIDASNVSIVGDVKGDIDASNVTINGSQTGDIDASIVKVNTK